MPSDFARQPRGLEEVKRWKATEFRQFLIYSGPVVLKGILAGEYYKHFLCFSVAIKILLDADTVFRNHCDILDQELVMNNLTPLASEGLICGKCSYT